MHGILPSSPTTPQSPDLLHSNDLGAVTSTFLKRAQRSAAARFAGPLRGGGCHTAQIAIPARPGGGACTGAIVAHVSAELVQTWARTLPGTPRQRKHHVVDQLHLLLKDLSDHDVHGYLALTKTQCEVYGQDLEQLVAEGLGRTSYAALGRPCRVRWEGTLVRSLQPPSFVLVLSIAF